MAALFIFMFHGKMVRVIPSLHYPIVGQFGELARVARGGGGEHKRGDKESGNLVQKSGGRKRKGRERKEGKRTALCKEDPLRTALCKEDLLRTALGTNGLEQLSSVLKRKKKFAHGQRPFSKYYVYFLAF